MTLDGPCLRRLAAGEGPRRGPFARALLEREGPALGFLPALPTDDAAWRRCLDEAARASRPRPGLGLAARQAALGRPPAAVAAAGALERGEAVAVATGQQPGLLGGPLLSFHKAAGAIHLARRLSALGGPRVVPVFWSADEDHDVAESDRVAVVGADGDVHAAHLGLPVDGRSLGDHVVPAGAVDVPARLAEWLPRTPRAAAVLGLLEDRAPRPGTAYARASLEAFLALLGADDLVVVEAQDVLAHVPDVLGDLVRDGPRVVAEVEAAGRRLVAAGLPAPLDVPPGGLPLFVRDEPHGPRRRPDDGGAADVLARLARDPRLVSTDAAGRVLVQNALLPVVAYVAGPTEIAYQAQVLAAASALRRAVPLALPRPEATFVEPRVEEALAAFGLDVGALLRAEGAPPPPPAAVPAWLAALEERLLAWPEDVLEAERAGGATGAALGRARGALEAAWRKARRGVEAGLEADQGRDRGRLARAVHALLPRGRPQERVLSPLSLAARHGLEDLRRAWSGLDPLVPGHVLVPLGT